MKVLRFLRVVVGCGLLAMIWAGLAAWYLWKEVRKDVNKTAVNPEDPGDCFRRYLEVAKKEKAPAATGARISAAKAARSAQKKCSPWRWN